MNGVHISADLHTREPQKKYKALVDCDNLIYLAIHLNSMDTFQRSCSWGVNLNFIYLNLKAGSSIAQTLTAAKKYLSVIE